MVTVSFDDWSMITRQSAIDIVDVLLSGKAHEISGGRIEIDVPVEERDVTYIPVFDDLFEDVVGR